MDEISSGKISMKSLEDAIGMQRDLASSTSSSVCCGSGCVSTSIVI